MNEESHIKISICQSLRFLRAVSRYAATVHTVDSGRCTQAHRHTVHMMHMHTAHGVKLPRQAMRKSVDRDEEEHDEHEENRR